MPAFISIICRYFLCLTPYLILVSNPDIIYHITGPITIPPFDNISLIYWIGTMEFVRIFYPYFLKILLPILRKSSGNSWENKCK